MRASRISGDIAELIRGMQRHGVRFLLVGGHAVIYYGYPRLTGDVDLWFDQKGPNVDALWEALIEFWQGDVPGLTAREELLEPGVIVMFGRPPNRVDLIGELSGAFDDAWGRRVRATIDVETDSLEVDLIAFEHLLANKRASGRHKDQEDIEQLTRCEGDEPGETG